jgi:uncharacterized repeat protein (TIGR03803 family)
MSFCKPHSTAFGFAVVLFGALAFSMISPCLVHAQNYTVLHSFGNGDDGLEPFGPLLLDTADNLYGTTTAGGQEFWGTVFKLNSAGEESILHAFGGSPDGAQAEGSLVNGGNGTLYGTTFKGGDYNYGTVYRLTKAGRETVYSFAGPGGDGAFPIAGLVADTQGNLYGTTYQGGSSNDGIVFKISTTTGKETILHNFTGGSDGMWPQAGLVLDNAGNLYGTTVYGGTDNIGTVFKVTRTAKETVVHSFTDQPDGSQPDAALLFTDGKLYGTTYYGGAYGHGTVFSVDATGKETVVYSFVGGSEGGWPWASLITDGAGDLYGTTSSGFSGNGTVFKIDSSGNEIVLYAFTGGADGGDPQAALVRDSAGNLYGTTFGGGAYSAGVVFKLTP